MILKRLTILNYRNIAEAELELLNEAESVEEAEYYAEDILSHNIYVKQAYRHLGIIAYMRGDADGMVQNFESAVHLGKYDMSLYRFYDTMLQEMTQWQGMTNEQYMRLEEARGDLSEWLKNVEKETDSIAYRLRDVPVFEY